MQYQDLYMGLDIGSTTIKAVVLTEEGENVFEVYQRHFSDIKLTLADVLKQVQAACGAARVHTVISGSGGLGISQMLKLPFYQEVSSCAAAVQARIPQTSVVIELGGEDAKIIYFSEHGVEQRMNGACAGGTGAFIDQMASLLQTDAAGLNELAKSARIIYPIASRCGVFAKTDIQPLLNQGAAKEDIAASVFRAVVNQTIVGLAAGKPIRGTVAFLGGPLHYLDQLTAAFVEVLKLDEHTAIIPPDGQYYVAIGAALKAIAGEYRGTEELHEYADVAELLAELDRLDINTVADAAALRPLFSDEAEYAEFKARHSRHKAPVMAIEECMQGRVYVGIDAGSTTSKAVVIDKDGNILYSYYGSNMGEPVELCLKIMKEIYARLDGKFFIANVGVTGYGEELIKAALNADFGEVETLAHYRAARQFMPEVDFILDIGGQDMKAIKVRDGLIDDIILNEACSSGCGSFIETFAKSLDMSVEEFAAAALRAKKPVDMGSRCTVFMNSKVKQAQKEGASVEDISAGLSYSVIKNALYKVIKLRRAEEFGKNVLVQGGTFKNEAILRAFELETGVEAVCPDIAGLMGAYGAALLAVERWTRGKHSTVLSQEELQQLSFRKSFEHCGKCTNDCLLTRISFSNGAQFVSGNRCERGAAVQTRSRKPAPNLFDYEYKRVFDYKPLKNAPRGRIGIPRALNMYENYPFWFTLLTRLGFEVVLSPASGKKLFEKGMESIPSEAVCYPAKLVHGHIEALFEKGIDTVFYPCVMFEHKEYSEGNNHYNCPVVSGYPEVIRNNVDAFLTQGKRIIKPFINFDDKKKMRKMLQASFAENGIELDMREIKAAVRAAYAEQAAFKNDIKVKVQETLEYMEEQGIQGIILAGRPYHLDPEINHGIPNLFSQSGLAVLTVTGAARLSAPERPLRVVDQWVFHSRLYAAATLAAKRSDLGMVQLVSFGCGLDAITSDQIAEILHRHGKLFTSIKIDEGDNLGAARIRVRSLKVAMEERRNTNTSVILPPPRAPRFEKPMRSKYTILAPQMSPIHFQFLDTAFSASGYKLKLLPEVTPAAKEAGLKYVHNDACYPCLLTTGQLIDALQSGEYDLDKTAVIMSQTGGQCRATNYIALIRKALDDAGFKQVPVISLSAAATQKQPGFTYSIPMILRLVMSIVYGDVFMKTIYRVRPYVSDKAQLDALYDKWTAQAKKDVERCSWPAFCRHQRQIIEEFDALPIDDSERKPLVGLVGEILVKFSPDANNKVVDIVESLGGEAVMPPMIDFFSYATFGNYYRSFFIKGGLLNRFIAKATLSAIEFSRRSAENAYRKSRRFHPDSDIFTIARMASEVLSLGHSAGEGWFLTGEMSELLESGVNNIICMQPFACLPNHITGRGMVKELRRLHPQANIVAVDYDPGASETNQLNRIKLMMEQAFREKEEVKGQ